MGNDLKQMILEYNGVISPEVTERKPSILNCPRCNLVNPLENKYCSKCSYPLVPSAFEEIKLVEDLKINELKEKHEKDMKELREQTDEKLDRILSLLQENPKLAKVKKFYNMYNRCAVMKIDVKKVTKHVKQKKSTPRKGTESKKGR
jgi:ribosomal protein L40E